MVKFILRMNLASLSFFPLLLALGAPFAAELLSSLRPADRSSINNSGERDSFAKKVQKLKIAS